ncbi:hypothetical protein [Conexibacter sp. SYSU D00693]|uniref:hypothetical protein n=1 Tax=Conexibacter sp. SYSU D00693 TaxID=2812560 RepID=UPI00196BA01D|nr:hypothetical protein [Conexibacter sp. SYSU D00693]
MSSVLLSSSEAVDALVIRPATPADAHALARLAALDSARPLTGDVLLAERGGRLLAARSLRDGRSVADPFQPTADVVEVLALRATALLDAPRPTSSARLRSLFARRRAVAA